jgi:hypothetical protein
MPKAPKERLKHSSSLSAQLQNDGDPQVSESKRAKRKRKAEEEEGNTEGGEQVISGKMGRQILAMAREQQDEEEVEEESEQEDSLHWRESQMLTVSKM